MTNKIDFDEIRRSYPLPHFVESSHVKLKKSTNGFVGCCPFHSEKTGSFNIYQSTDIYKYYCFGCGAKGDIFDYAQDLYGVTIQEAVEMITGDESRPPQKQYAEIADPYVNYKVIDPPKTQPRIVAGEKTPWILNPRRVDPDTGKPKLVNYTPSMVFPYKDQDGELLGYVIRVDFADNKITPGVWWVDNEQAEYAGWSHGSYPEPRPLYGLDQLHQNPDKQVLIVEGEKCKDAAESLLPNRLVAVSWMGGGNAISKVDWQALAGRSVILWPDNDAPGWHTMLGSVIIRKDGEFRWQKGIIEYLFEARVSRVKVVHITPETRDKGWDIADAQKEGLDGSGIALIIKDRIQEWSKERFLAYKNKKIEEADPTEPDEINSPPEKIKTTSPQSQDEIDKDNWKDNLILDKDGEKLRASSLQNIALMLEFNYKFKNIFCWNEFAREVFITRRPLWDATGKKGQWEARMLIETDVISATCWLEYCGLSPKMNDVGKIIQRISSHKSFNPVTDKLNKLVWDKKPRLSGDKQTAPWLSKYFGADQTEINRVFGMKWLIGAVARAYKPGCKMDNMIILEGPQGLKKSSALRTLTQALGPNLFTDEISDPGSKDAGLQMQGIFIVEIAELDAFRKAEISQLKSWISRPVDKFRRPYGKIVEDFPRTCVFAGTVNPSGTGYLKDASGGRRFWPVQCYEIDLEELKKDALQIWAEAVVYFKKGDIWWLDDNEIAKAKESQEERYEYDPYGEMIDDYCAAADLFKGISILGILNHLEILKAQRTPAMAKRIGSHLEFKGYRKSVIDGKVIYTLAD